MCLAGPVGEIVTTSVSPPSGTRLALRPGSAGGFEKPQLDSLDRLLPGELSVTVPEQSEGAPLDVLPATREPCNWGVGPPAATDSPPPAPPPRTFLAIVAAKNVAPSRLVPAIVIPPPRPSV